MRKFFTVAACAAGAVCVAACPDTDTSAEKARGAGEAAGIVQPERVDTALRALVENGEAVGASALIYEKGEEVYFGAFGMADGKTERPMTRDTIAQIYSMTKPITGVALMTLYEKGKFELDDPIAKYVPELANLEVYAGEDENGDPILVEPKRPPTVRDFTRHTAGLASGNGQTPVDEWYRRENPLDRANSYDEMAERM
jgi:CubicO group peptidase (beta-lactamase class C family)